MNQIKNLNTKNSAVPGARRKESEKSGSQRCQRSRSLPQWGDYTPLLSPPASTATKFLEDFPNILADVWPLNASHRKKLPEDIAALSHILTNTRSFLKIPYWSKPGFISAYLYYFLPWNLVRLCHLLPGLPLLAPKWDNSPVFVDAGSGPLTLPIALWLTHPDWQTRPLDILAVDSAIQPLQLGRKIFYAIQAEAGRKSWAVHIAASPLRMLASEIRGHLRQKNHANPGHLWLIGLANVLNELPAKRTRRCASFAEETGSGEDKLFGTLDNLGDNLSERTQILVIEPGTRLGGTTIMHIRQQALELGFFPLAPCTHDRPCPLDTGPGANGSHEKSWCHFSFPVAGAPKWLVQLSREAGLAKKSLSLSPLLLGLEKPQYGKGFSARVISQSFPVIGLSPHCRYACARLGRCLMPNAENVPSGALVQAIPNPDGLKDRKTSSPVIEAAPHKSPQPKSRIRPPQLSPRPGR